MTERRLVPAAVLWAALVSTVLLPAAHALDNGLALTPPQGWSTWAYFSQHINESLIMEMGDLLVSTGLAKHGYTYLMMDDGYVRHAHPVCTCTAPSGTSCTAQQARAPKYAYTQRRQAKRTRPRHMQHSRTPALRTNFDSCTWKCDTCVGFVAVVHNYGRPPSKCLGL